MPEWEMKISPRGKNHGKNGKYKNTRILVNRPAAELCKIILLLSCMNKVRIIKIIKIFQSKMVSYLKYHTFKYRI